MNFFQNDNSFGKRIFWLPVIFTTFFLKRIDKTQFNLSSIYLFLQYPYKMFVIAQLYKDTFSHCAKMLYPF